MPLPPPTNNATATASDNATVTIDNAATTADNAVATTDNSQNMKFE
jgi:hypothetical protein